MSNEFKDVCWFDGLCLCVSVFSSLSLLTVCFCVYMCRFLCVCHCVCASRYLREGFTKKVAVLLDFVQITSTHPPPPLPPKFMYMLVCQFVSPCVCIPVVSVSMCFCVYFSVCICFCVSVLLSASLFLSVCLFFSPCVCL